MEEDRQEGKKEDQKSNAQETTRKWLTILYKYIVLIVVFCLFIYMIINIEHAKTALSSCQMCFEKYNLTCFNSNLELVVH